MSSLTETAYYTRRTINWIILGLIAYFILKILWAILVAVLLAIFPPQSPPPNHAFGVLPSLKFPQSATPSAQLSFKLETIEGSIPKASDSAMVYFMPKSASDYLGLNKFQKFAAQLQLNETPNQEKNSKTMYQFDDPEFSLRSLSYDIVSNNFTLKYDYAIDTSVFGNSTLPNESSAVQQAYTTLQPNDKFPPGFSQDNIRSTYLKLVGDTLIPSVSVTEANAIRIDFFRNPLNGLNMFYPDPTKGPISIIFSGSSNLKKKILEMDYIYWPIDTGTNATYKLKTSAQAWQELQSGNGFIAHYPTNGSSVTIRSVHLGYYDSIEPQTYLQPIFVFEGDDGFLGYVSAVAPPWTE